MYVLCVYLCAQVQLLCSFAPFARVCSYIQTYYILRSNIVTQVRHASSSCLIFNFISRPSLPLLLRYTISAISNETNRKSN